MAIAVDLFFPGNQRIRVILIYLTTTNKKLNEETQKTVADWIKQAIARQLKVIVMGDFNSDRNREKKLIPLFKALDQLGMFSMLNYFDITEQHGKEETWKVK